MAGVRRAALKKGKHWKSDEIDLLLSLVEERLPLGGNEWDTLSLQYNVRRAMDLQWAPERDPDSCRTKFKTLKNVKKPTGDPTCPPNVRKAKRIRRATDNELPMASIERVRCLMNLIKIKFQTNYIIICNCNGFWLLIFQF